MLRQWLIACAVSFTLLATMPYLAPQLGLGNSGQAMACPATSSFGGGC